MAQDSQDQRCDFKETWHRQRQMFAVTAIGIAATAGIVAFSIAASFSILLGWMKVVDFMIDNDITLPKIILGLVILLAVEVVIYMLSPTLEYLGCKAKQLAKGAKP